MGDRMLHISSAHIEGYKSIFKADVTFSSGLNIIIGKNGAGKSNLLSILEGLLLEKRNLTGTATVQAKVVNGAGQTAEFSSRFTNGSVELKTDKALLYVLNSKDALAYFSGHEDLQLDSNRNLELVTIPHSIPKDIPFLDRRIDVQVNRVHQQAEQLWKILVDEAEPYFARSLAAVLFHLVRYVFADSDQSRNEYDTLKFWAGEIIKVMQVCLTEITPIRGMRLSESVAYRESTTRDLAQLINIAFQFKIGESWFDFDQLSDGTKRMAYVAFCIAAPRMAFPTMNGINHLGLDVKSHQIIFLEEPELGIHPHQLHLLLLFLREQAKTQQIIITTHSPQVLDILDKDELDKIIVADYDPEKGSRFTHLAEDKKAKALAYMQDMLLSDYWRFSDLEPQTAK